MRINSKDRKRDSSALEKERIRMADWRKRNSKKYKAYVKSYKEKNLDEIRKRDREKKKIGRLLNTPYAQKHREAMRSEKRLARRKELRRSKSSLKKEAEYIRKYRKASPEQKIKNIARVRVHYAIKTGKLKRPSHCEICGAKHKKLHDGRHGLRADHYKGYEVKNALIVRFICVKCDGKQMRKHK